ncbi:indolepyruvate ferredoxin oxidoreductase subunit alpha [Paenibacillus mendelii]|uniref:Ferredoxin n=1 Tax=Paenibacillus mendelii TaxID=206163 RepID=A0ABV6JBE2_9BACL|nr:4Fe-4S dicluster domain-containing protein [Paenibacillus mendelii]MCQ6558576.1 4Fe-4S binding protein [Paenibacillus mendelii]
MGFVITAKCIDEKAADCVDVCPVDCIAEGPDQYFIDVEICIDCGACEAACPVDAVVWEDEMTDEDKVFYDKAEKFFRG